jgi:K+-transporting ATPase ATPase C chain
VLREVRPAILVFVILSIVTGAIYPLIVTGIAQLAFPTQANGSLIERNGKIVGSALIGQPFSDPKYFWSRPSATAAFPYDPSSSSGSNQGPLNPALTEAVKARIGALHAADPTQTKPIPIDLVTASGSGLDPHISPAAAAYQISRIARVRGLPEDRVRDLVARHTEGRQWTIFGEPRVNVLKLNLALDSLGAPPLAVTAASS